MVQDAQSGIARILGLQGRSARDRVRGCVPPQGVGHGIEIGKVDGSAERIAAIE